MDDVVVQVVPLHNSSTELMILMSRRTREKRWEGEEKDTKEKLKGNLSNSERTNGFSLDICTVQVHLCYLNGGTRHLLQNETPKLHGNVPSELPSFSATCTTHSVT